MSKHTLTVNNLTKKYGDKTALSHVSFTLENGLYGLIGANGAGKTTLMRLLCDIQKPTEGTIEYDGISIAELGEQYRSILGYLPQHFGYYPGFTPMSFLMYMSELKGLEKADAEKRTELLLGEVGLSEVMKKRIGKLSGGMKQRVGIAQALLNDPKVLILDEPTAGLDPRERARFQNMITELSQDKIILLSTHIVSDVERSAKSFLFVNDGDLVFNGRMPSSYTSLDEMYMDYFGEDGKNETDFMGTSQDMQQTDFHSCHRSITPRSCQRGG